jgi:putative transposase
MHMSDPRSPTEVSSVSEYQWTEARRCLEVIQNLARKTCRTRIDVGTAATNLGYSRAQVYVLLSRYLADPRLTSLVPRRRGPTRGTSRFSNQIDALVEETIESVYLNKQRPRIADLVSEVRRRCHTAGVAAPSRKAITTRLRLKPRREIVARREGRKAARDQFAPAIGSLEAHWPLSLVQIDHTPVDVIVVDTLTRAPIQRPWLTLGIDVFFTMRRGFSSIARAAVGDQRCAVYCPGRVAKGTVARRAADRGGLADSRVVYLAAPR